MLEFWYIPLIVALPLFFLWTLVHESAHAAQVLLLDGEITNFKPYPCKIGDRWFFGYVGFKVPGLNAQKRAEIAVAPYLVDIAVSLVLMLALFGHDLPLWARILVVTLMAAPAFNTMNQGRLALQKKECDLVENGDTGPAILLSVAQFCLLTRCLISTLVQ